jgi:hypothetical protein
MNKKSWLRVLKSGSDNLKPVLSPSTVSTLSIAEGLRIDSAEGSKTSTELSRSIKNRNS